ncbi:MAG TPA: hypothetical protein VJZ51_05780 [Bacilli bacterium]|nr:hypothetical protein [Bacilli bacterium]
MEKIKMRTKFDYRTMKYCNMYLLTYKRKSFYLYIFLVLLSIGASIYFGFFSGETNLLMAGLFLLVAAYVTYQAFSVEKALDKHLQNFFHNRPVVEQIIELDEEKIIITASSHPNEPQTHEWLFVTEIHEIPQYYMLFIGKNTPIILDRSADALLEGSFADLAALIKEKAELKPYKVVDKDILRKPITYIHQYIEPVHNIEDAEIDEENDLEQLEVTSVDEAEVIETEEDKKA